MRKTLLAITAGLLLALPAACTHPGHHAGPGGQGCQKHQRSDCKCRQQPDCPKPDCPSRPDCPQNRPAEAPPAAK